MECNQEVCKGSKDESKGARTAAPPLLAGGLRGEGLVKRAEVVLVGRVVAQPPLAPLALAQLAAAARAAGLQAGGQMMLVRRYAAKYIFVPSSSSCYPGPT